MVKRASLKAVGMWVGIGGGVLAAIGVGTAGADGAASRTPPMAVRPTGAAPLPPPPLPSLPSAPPGSHPIWPRGLNGTGPAYSSPSAVAADFATQVLGIADPTVNEPSSVSASGIGTVTISLPTGDGALAVLTQRQVAGNWTITQVGEQSRLEGITMLPGGKPGPIWTIHPPAAATSADLTEVTADRTYEIHLTAQDLRAGVAHLVAPESLSVLLGAPIHNVLIVYRDRANRAIDALGGEFG